MYMQSMICVYVAVRCGEYYYHVSWSEIGGWRIREGRWEGGGICSLGRKMCSRNFTCQPVHSTLSSSIVFYLCIFLFVYLCNGRKKIGQNFTCKLGRASLALLWDERFNSLSFLQSFCSLFLLQIISYLKPQPRNLLMICLGAGFVLVKKVLFRLKANVLWFDRFCLHTSHLHRKCLFAPAHKCSSYWFLAKPATMLNAGSFAVNRH